MRPTFRAIAAAAFVAAACDRPLPDDGENARARPAPPRPAQGVDVAAGDALRAAVAAAAPGSTLRLADGVHEGPIAIDKALTIWGSAEAVIRTSGTGTTVDVAAAGVRLLGFTVDGSGGRFELTDAAVRVRADDVLLEGLQVRNALFGILVEQSNRATVRNNFVAGNGEPALGLRGDGIRLWEVRDSVVEQNEAHDCRDVVVWYSERCRLLGNHVRGSRYGTHFMYCHDIEVERNTYADNVVAIFVMYSHRVRLRDNTLARSGGAAGMGLGVKESDGLEIERNRILFNTKGIYLDNSPIDRNEHNRFRHNEIAMGEGAVVFHGPAAGNEFTGNSLHDNHAQVQVQGGGDARAAVWSGNHFDDYQGYDLDADGHGDIAYELRSLSGELTAKQPDLLFFRGMPALDLVEITGRVLPMFAPTTVIVDPKPSMAAPAEVPRAR